MTTQRWAAYVRSETGRSEWYNVGSREMVQGDVKTTYLAARLTRRCISRSSS